MARRDRVPRHKSHNHKRNKNAKLSPFQREQKRAKMANQVPTASTMGALDSVPHSQRHVFDYLQEKMRQQKEKRAALALERQQQQQKQKEENAEGNAQDAAASSSATSRSSPSSKGAAGTPKAAKKSKAKDAPVSDVASSANPEKKNKKNKMVYASLNDELTASVGVALQPAASRYGTSSSSSTGASADAERDPNAPRTVEEIIARKKERKHKRKQEARRARVAAQLESMEAELEDYVKNANGPHKKKKGKGEKGEKLTARDRVNLAFERQLRTLNKEAEQQHGQEKMAAADEREHSSSATRKRSRGERNAEGTPADDGEGMQEGSRKYHTAEAEEGHPHEDAQPTQPQRKRISFDPDVADPTAGAQAARRAAKNKKPQDFYELVDVVRYGERVEAPPVFDVVPNRNAAVTRLANQLEREAAAATAGRRRANGGGVGGADERHRLLSGAGQLGEQKRLARLGLAPAITHTIRADGGSGGGAAAAAARMSKEEEIKALRDRVMATYQRNRRKEVTEKKGVDMRHEFPKFA